MVRIPYHVCLVCGIYSDWTVELFSKILNNDRPKKISLFAMFKPGEGKQKMLAVTKLVYGI